MPRAIHFDRIGGPEVLRMEQVEVGEPGPGQAHTLGVTMIGTVSTEEKAEIARAHGCTHTMVFDSVGKDTLLAALVSNGTSSGPVNIGTRVLAGRGSLWVTRPAMVHYATPRTQMLAMARELFDHELAGNIVGEPKQVFALEDAALAHAALEGPKTVSATVMVP